MPPVSKLLGKGVGKGVLEQEEFLEGNNRVVEPSCHHREQKTSWLVAEPYPSEKYG